MPQAVRSGDIPEHWPSDRGGQGTALAARRDSSQELGTHPRLAYTPPNGNPGAIDNTIYRLAYNEVTQRLMIASFEAFLIKMS